MSSFRRRMMTNNIVWDYEWYPPEEKPSWFTVTNTYVTTEEGSNYFRLYCANKPDNAMNRLLFGFLASEFPNTKSYLVEIDMFDKASKYATSSQGGICFCKSTGIYTGGIWIKRTNNKVPGKDYYQAILASADNKEDGPYITDEFRYKIRLLYDVNNGVLKASVDNAKFSINATGITMREVYSRYTNGNYIDIYSVKIKVIE